MTSEQLKNTHISHLRSLCSAATIDNPKMKATLENIIEDYNQQVHNLYKTTSKFRKGVPHKELEICKHVIYEAGHGFILSEFNDSIYLTDDEAIDLAGFIADNHKSSKACLMVKTTSK